jgi:hypothetical protein
VVAVVTEVVATAVAVTEAAEATAVAVVTEVVVVTAVVAVVMAEAVADVINHLRIQYLDPSSLEGFFITDASQHLIIKFNKS